MEEERKLEGGIIPQMDGTLDVTIHDPETDDNGIGNGRSEGSAFAAALVDLDR